MAFPGLDRFSVHGTATLVCVPVCHYFISTGLAAARLAG
jgi:hypothetical protein